MTRFAKPQPAPEPEGFDGKRLNELLNALESSPDYPQDLRKEIFSFIEGDALISQAEVQEFYNNVNSDLKNVKNPSEKTIEGLRQLRALAGIDNPEFVTQFFVESGLISQDSYDEVVARMKPKYAYAPGRYPPSPFGLEDIPQPLGRGRAAMKVWKQDLREYFAHIARIEMSEVTSPQDHALIMMRERRNMELTKGQYPVTRYNYYNDEFEARYGVRFSGVGIVLDQISDSELTDPRERKRAQKTSSFSFSPDQIASIQENFGDVDPLIKRRLHESGAAIRDHNTVLQKEGEAMDRRYARRHPYSGTAEFVRRKEQMSDEEIAEAAEATGIEPIEIPYGRADDKICIEYSSNMAPGSRSIPGKSTSQIWINNDGIVAPFHTANQRLGTNNKEGDQWKRDADAIGLEVIQRDGKTLLVFTQGVPGYLQVTEVSGRHDSVVKRMRGSVNGKTEVFDIDDGGFDIAALNYRDSTGTDAEYLEHVGRERWEGLAPSEKESKKELLEKDVERLRVQNTPEYLTKKFIEFISNTGRSWTRLPVIDDSRIKYHSAEDAPYFTIDNNVVVSVFPQEIFNKVADMSVPMPRFVLKKDPKSAHVVLDDQVRALMKLNEWVGGSSENAIQNAKEREEAERKKNATVGSIDTNRTNPRIGNAVGNVVESKNRTDFTFTIPAQIIPGDFVNVFNKNGRKVAFAKVTDSEPYTTLDGKTVTRAKAVINRTYEPVDNLRFVAGTHKDALGQSVLGGAKANSEVAKLEPAKSSPAASAPKPTPAPAAEAPAPDPFAPEAPEPATPAEVVEFNDINSLNAALETLNESLNTDKRDKQDVNQLITRINSIGKSGLHLISSKLKDTITDNKKKAFNIDFRRMQNMKRGDLVVMKTEDFDNFIASNNHLLGELRKINDSLANGKSPQDKVAALEEKRRIARKNLDEFAKKYNLETHDTGDGYVISLRSNATSDVLYVFIHTEQDGTVTYKYNPEKKVQEWNSADSVNELAAPLEKRINTRKREVQQQLLLRAKEQLLNLTESDKKQFAEALIWYLQTRKIGPQNLPSVETIAQKIQFTIHETDEQRSELFHSSLEAIGTLPGKEFSKLNDQLENIRLNPFELIGMYKAATSEDREDHQWNYLKDPGFRKLNQGRYPLTIRVVREALRQHELDPEDVLYTRELYTINPRKRVYGLLIRNNKGGFDFIFSEPTRV